jgi:hypothetical protein
MKNLVAVLVITAASVAIMVIVLFNVNRKPDSRLNVSSKMRVGSIQCDPGCQVPRT